MLVDKIIVDGLLDLLQMEFCNYNPYHDKRERFTTKWESLINVDYEKELAFTLKVAKQKDNANAIAKIGLIDKNAIEKVKADLNIDLTGYTHLIDVYGIKHAYKKHGNKITEQQRGQIALVDDDFKLIPKILYSPDNIKCTGKNDIGRETITYSKKMKDGIIFYVEEIRTKHKTLALNTMYKKSATV